MNKLFFVCWHFISHLVLASYVVLNYVEECIIEAIISSFLLYEDGVYHIENQIVAAYKLCLCSQTFTHNTFNIGVCLCVCAYIL